MSVINITKENFQQEVMESEKTVLVDFFATWCGPCKMLSPVIDEIAEEREDIKVCKVDIDQAQELAIEYGVMTVPNLVVFKDGQVVSSAAGLRPKQQIMDMIV